MIYSSHEPIYPICTIYILVRAKAAVNSLHVYFLVRQYAVKANDCHVLLAKSLS